MITDWDDAYANGAYIPDADDYPADWARRAAAYRSEKVAEGRAMVDLTYGPHERQAMEIFQPDGASKGLVVFVHGGYWRWRDRNLWWHLAKGAVERGWSVAMPGYVLCPEVRISDITRQIARAVAFAAERVDGPIRLIGHSAGGHLVSRLGCRDIVLPCAERVEKIVSISGVFDLRPLLNTEMNEDFKMDLADAVAESPALQMPHAGTDITCWVGANERPEFVRQNAMLANIWTGLGARTTCVEEAGLHHFSVIESLTEPDGALTNELLR